MILCITLNPVLDSTFYIDRFRPVYRTDARKLSYQAGGKATNVARALRLLGTPARALIVLGGGVGRLAGESLRQEMAADGCPPVIAWVSGETRLQVTVVDDTGEQRSYYAPPAPFTTEDADAVRQATHAALSEACAVCLCGSSPGPLADDLYHEIVELVASRGLPVLLDSYGAGLRRGLAARPDIVKMNRAEAEGLLGRTLADEAGCRQALAELQAAGAGQAILTLGGDGALLAAPGGVWRGRPPAGVQAVNPIGSGDAFSAGYMAALRRGESPEACFRLGMAAAVANTLSWEACHFDPADVEQLLPAIEIERVG